MPLDRQEGIPDGARERIPEWLKKIIRMYGLDYFGSGGRI